MTAKISDFGLARLGPQSPGATHTVTQTIIGTIVFIPKEYLNDGVVSVKFDAYSYGIVSKENVFSLIFLHYCLFSFRCS
jgi:serine/threonine protein kinase